jgi:predicted alpha/beta superfamily hydrolase
MTTLPFSDGSGAVIRYADWQPQGDLLPRHVDVWCPPNYDSDSARRYLVLYMHDGQNLFDPGTGYANQDWGIDEAMIRLMHESNMPGAVVVGIWCSDERRRDYMPQKPLELPEAKGIQRDFLLENGGAPKSDAYLKFLVEEVKPFIDSNYRTLPDQANTLIMGSSMGGLISLYALTEYPQVFGGAGCVSTHWPIGDIVLVDYFGSAIPKPGSHRLYFDFGTATLDALYEPFQRRMDEHMRKAGYQADRDWMTRKFEGAEHNEPAWRARVHIPLTFLLLGKVL